MNEISHSVLTIWPCWCYRSLACHNWICSVWWSLGLLEKEPWIKWYLFQRPGCKAANKSDVTAVDKVFLASSWRDALFVFKKCKLLMGAGSGRIIVFRSNFEVLIFVEGLEETLRAKTRANQLNPHVMAGPGQGPEPHYCELMLSRIYTVLPNCNLVLVEQYIEFFFSSYASLLCYGVSCPNTC